MAKELHPADPQDLIAEAYRIEDISLQDCRTIFFDWAVGRPENTDLPGDVQTLLDHHGHQPKDHPMTQVLTEGLQAAQKPRRRGGWRSRRET